MVCPASARRTDQVLPVPAGSKPGPRTEAAPTLSAAAVGRLEAQRQVLPIRSNAPVAGQIPPSDPPGATLQFRQSPRQGSMPAAYAARPSRGLLSPALSSRRCAARAPHAAQVRLIPNPPRMAASTCRRHELRAPDAGQSRRVPSPMPGSSIAPRARTGNGCDGRRFAGGRGGPSLTAAVQHSVRAGLLFLSRPRKERFLGRRSI